MNLTRPPTRPQWNAVVLGGGDPNDPLAAAHHVHVKTLIPVAGHPMALHVLRALRDSGRVGRIAYVGPTTPDMDPLIDVRVTDQGQLLRNLEAGVQALGDTGARVLVSTADIPMLRPEELRDLLDEAPDAALVYPVVRRQDCEAAYPGVQRTFVKVRDGSFTGGNLFLLDPGLVGKFLPRLREVLAARKAPLKLAALIGPSVLLKLLTGRLTVKTLEEKVSAILQVPARALITPHASVGTDIDKEDDLTLAERILRA